MLHPDLHRASRGRSQDGPRLKRLGGFNAVKLITHLHNVAICPSPIDARAPRPLRSIGCPIRRTVSKASRLPNSLAQQMVTGLQKGGRYLTLRTPAPSRRLRDKTEGYRTAISNSAMEIRWSQNRWGRDGSRIRGNLNRG